MKEVEKLWEEVRELSLGNNSRIQRLDAAPTAVEFLREFVSQNKPCIINKANLHWPALSLWTQLSYLSKTMSSSLVSLHLTPNGRADSLVKHPSLDQLCFASAHVQQLPFDQALQLVLSNSNSTDSKVVAYLQQQNDCFRSEYSVLGSDCDQHIPWATEALECYPEAVNLWIGNHLSETSFHKDHYENLYAVVSGQKHFLLLPPTDVHRMYIRHYPAAHYSYSQDMLECTLELETPAIHVPWCSVNPYPSPETRETEMAKFPLFFNGPKPFECTVNAGEILYLPSMWFHHVRQSPDENGVTVAVNYWYDMQFDIKYAYFNFLQSIHYKSPHDPTLSEIECEDSGSDASVHNLRDEVRADTLTLNAKQDNEDKWV
ncbi:hypothetical protein Dsin_023636 [Dipteronia sinensis]|uniref:JmjC domain-containing protein n=1 Tax=Dipteronia sinensis TaxID=43782 RepID=A0AAE0A553_9ROSI|nr:hypothetical protein Dsin_023636 [Dipteronia sinensis]